MWKDRQLYAALGAAVIFWVILFALTGPAPQWGWPLREPWLFLWPALLYPVMEEIIFRGLIQDLVREKLKPWRLGPVSHANLITSLLFTALHFINHPALWAAAVLVPSLVFGYFKDRHGSLATPIVLHVFYNAGYFWLFAPPPLVPGCGAG